MNRRRVGRIASALVGALAALMAVAAAPAAAQQTAVVPNRVIYPGQPVSMDALDVVPLRRALPNPSAIALDLAQFEGKVARNTLLPGRLVPVSAMRDAYAVEAGAPVQVVFVHGALTISITGVPLQPGAAGDLIKVRNIDSGAVFTGVVLADGTIRVGAT
jgi:flagella basal body P-ring formation protein FlgA